MSKIKNSILETDDALIEPEYEPRIPEDLPEFNHGVWFQSVASGCWYRNAKDAGDVGAVRINGDLFKSSDEYDDGFDAWWRELDADMLSENPPFDNGEPVF